MAVEVKKSFEYIAVLKHHKRKSLFRQLNSLYCRGNPETKKYIILFVHLFKFLIRFHLTYQENVYGIALVD